MDVYILQNETPQVVSAFAGAFFAFVFFVIGESWLSSKRRSSKIIFTLKTIREYIAFQIYPLEINTKIARETIAIEKPISIFISRFLLFPIENQGYSKLDKYKVTGSILKFVIDLKLLNESVASLNSNIQELSDFSRVAILEKQEDEFQETMKENLNILKNNVQKFSKHLESTRSKITPLLIEVDFTLWYEQSYFWQKNYFKFRQRLDSAYRDKIIQKMSK